MGSVKSAHRRAGKVNYQYIANYTVSSKKVYFITGQRLGKVPWHNGDASSRTDGNLIWPSKV